jgi:hypothetical protein
MATHEEQSNDIFGDESDGARNNMSEARIKVHSYLIVLCLQGMLPHLLRLPASAPVLKKQQQDQELREAVQVAALVTIALVMIAPAVVAATLTPTPAQAEVRRLRLHRKTSNPLQRFV